MLCIHLGHPLFSQIDPHGTCGYLTDTYRYLGEYLGGLRRIRLIHTTYNLPEGPGDGIYPRRCQ